MATSSDNVSFQPNINLVRRALNRLIEDMVDLSTPNRRVAVLLDTWVQRNFQSEGGLVGGWKPFKLGGRRLPGGGIDYTAKLLQDTGQLRASFDTIFDSDSVEIWSDLYYAKFHEYGARNLPQRRMLPRGTDENLIRPMARIFNDWIRENARRKLW